MYINNLGHMTKMAAMTIYGEKLNGTLHVTMMITALLCV